MKFTKLRHLHNYIKKWNVASASEVPQGPPSRRVLLVPEVPIILTSNPVD